MIRAARSRATARLRTLRRKVSGSVTWVRASVASIPSWVIVLMVSALIGAGSAVVAVAGLARMSPSSVPELRCDWC